MATLTSDIASSIGNKANGAASEFKNKAPITGYQSDKMVDKMARSVGERMGSFASNIANTTTESLKSSREYVKDNPVRGVAIAAAVGAVAGGLLTLSMRRRKL